MSKKAYNQVDEVPTAPPLHSIPLNNVVITSESEAQALRAELNIHDDADFAHEDLVCRCCQDNNHKDDFIVPCSCSGSVKYVHRKCLDKWRSVAPNPEAFYRCEICHTNYVFQERPANANTARTKLKLAAYITLDFVGVLVVWQLLVFLGTLLAFVAGLRYKELGSFLPIPAFFNYYICGNLVFFFFMGILGIILGLVMLLRKCCGGSTNNNYTYNSYPYYYSTWDLNFFFCWYFSPFNMYYHSPPVIFCVPNDCHLGSMDCNGGSNDCGAVLAVIVVAIVAIVIVLGIFVALFLLIVIGSAIVTRRLSVLKRKSEIQDYIVMDLRNKH